MKIKKGEEAEFEKWRLKKSADYRNANIIIAVMEIGCCLDEGGPAIEAVKKIMKCPCGISLKEIGYVALVISEFHERGKEFRFEWNQHWRGEDWALGMELTDKRVYNPYGYK